MLSRLLIVVAMGVLPLGCGSDTTGPTQASAPLFWGLHFNWKAVNMALAAPYNTVQLTATPVTTTGDSIPGAGTPTYRVIDSSVAVSATGLVTAHYVTDKTPVIASLTVNGVTLVDTAMIRVTQNNPLAAQLATLSIHPQPDGLDSAKIALDGVIEMNSQGRRGTIPVYATVATGNPSTDTVCNIHSCPLLMGFTSSDPSIATIDPVFGEVTAVTPGHVTFVASSWVYGVGRRDSLPFAIGYALGIDIPAIISIREGGSPSHPTPIPAAVRLIGVGGVLRIVDLTSQPMEVTFAYRTPKVHRVAGGGVALDKLTDTVSVQGGLLPGVQIDSAGTYTYHITMLGSGESTTGKVVVSGGP